MIGPRYLVKGIKTDNTIKRIFTDTGAIRGDEH